MTEDVNQELIQALRELERKILNQDESLGPPAALPATPRARMVTEKIHAEVQGLTTSISRSSKWRVFRVARVARRAVG